MDGWMTKPLMVVVTAGRLEVVITKPEPVAEPEEAAVEVVVRLGVVLSTRDVCVGLVFRFVVLVSVVWVDVVVNNVVNKILSVDDGTVFCDDAAEGAEPEPPEPPLTGAKLILDDAAGLTKLVAGTLINIKDVGDIVALGDSAAVGADVDICKFEAIRGVDVETVAEVEVIEGVDVDVDAVEVAAGVDDVTAVIDTVSNVLLTVGIIDVLLAVPIELGLLVDWIGIVVVTIVELISGSIGVGCIVAGTVTLTVPLSPTSVGLQISALDKPTALSWHIVPIGHFPMSNPSNCDKSKLITNKPN